MKAWVDLKTVKLPLHMKALPRDARGYPVPWIAAVGSDGRADFRVIDKAKTMEALTNRRCAICGKVMLAAYFVGGPLSMRNRLFNDPPMHKDCAEYALKVCPFLAAPSFAYSRKTPDVDGMEVTVDPGMSEDRPEVFGIAPAGRYSLRQVQGEHYIHPVAWLRPVIWYKNGQVVEYRSPYGD
jgi:hypothetical protein